MRFVALVVASGCWTAAPHTIETRTLVVHVPQPCAWLWLPPEPAPCDRKLWGDDVCNDQEAEMREDWEHTVASYYRDTVYTQCGER